MSKLMFKHNINGKLHLTSGGYYCGYVWIPRTSNLRVNGGFPYYDFDDTSHIVHGGITYYNFQIIGFDCAHLGDFVPGLGRDSRQGQEKVRDEAFAMQELAKLIDYVHAQGYHEYNIRGEEYMRLQAISAETLMSSKERLDQRAGMPSVPRHMYTPYVALSPEDEEIRYAAFMEQVNESGVAPVGHPPEADPVLQAVNEE